MKCFLIMPFAVDFNDVHKVIKDNVQVDGVKCARLDEARPAGRITDRLLSELRGADFCISDITGLNPNVMWETGFAMALEKPIIIVFQVGTKTPFDLKDLQAVEYNRTRLNETLGAEIGKVARDTAIHIKESGAYGSNGDAATKTLVTRIVEALRAQAQASPIDGAFMK